MNPDMINALFSIGGSCFLWLNVWSLYKEREVKGVHWGSVAFFTILGFWNLFFYSTLSQWYSLFAGISSVMANIVWLCLVTFYRWDKIKLSFR